jgi:hypothetical protein
MKLGAAVLKYLLRSDYRFIFSTLVNFLLLAEFCARLLPNPRHSHKEAIAQAVTGMTIILIVAMLAAPVFIYALLLIPLYGLIITLVLVHRQIQLNSPLT